MAFIWFVVQVHHVKQLSWSICLQILQNNNKCCILSAGKTRLMKYKFSLLICFSLIVGAWNKVTSVCILPRWFVSCNCDFMLVYRDMWNYVDVLTLFVYIVIVLLRIVTIVRGGDPYQNSLLEVTNRLYGVNTLFVVMRFSSLLAVSSVVGPLQLALFRMFVDLLIILLQFGFVIAAFSLAITKIYTAEMSYLTPTHNQTEYHAEYDAWVNALFVIFSASSSSSSISLSSSVNFI